MTLPRGAAETVERVRLGFVATVGPDGRPNLSPKDTFLPDGDAVAFGEIRSPRTLANLAVNPDCEVNFVDPFTRKGIRLRGRAEILERGTKPFDRLFPRFETLWPTLAHRINAIVRIPADEVRPLTSPPYDDGVTEAEMIALHKARFAEMYS